MSYRNLITLSGRQLTALEPTAEQTSSLPKGKLIELDSYQFRKAQRRIRWALRFNRIKKPSKTNHE